MNYAAVRVGSRGRYGRIDLDLIAYAITDEGTWPVGSCGACSFYVDLQRHFSLAYSLALAGIITYSIAGPVEQCCFSLFGRAETKPSTNEIRNTAQAKATRQSLALHTPPHD